MSKRPPDASKQKRLQEKSAKQQSLDGGNATGTAHVYRVRAHANPFADRPIEHPVKPSCVKWDDVYGVSEPPTVADVGCAWGGLEIALGQRFPDTRVVGFELRQQVAETAATRVREAGVPGVAVILCHCEKHLACWLRPEQLDKVIVAFPDPHWKQGDTVRRLHRGLLCEAMLAQYAYFMKDGALLYTATDVRGFADAVFPAIDSFPLLQRVPDVEIADDPWLAVILTSTEQAQLIDRHGGDKHWAVYRRVPRSLSSSPSSLPKSA